MGTIIDYSTLDKTNVELNYASNFIRHTERLANPITEKMPACNRRLAQWRGTWLIEHPTSHQLLWCIDSFVLRNPPLSQAPKRYLQA